MTGKYADDQKHLKAALDHAVRGDREAADAELAVIAAKTMDHQFRLWGALAETAIYPLRHRATAGGAPFGLAAFAAYAGTGIDDAPPEVGIAVRFVAAQAVHQAASLRSLYLDAREAGAAVVAGVQALLLDAAVESAHAQLAARDSGQPGSGA